MGLEKLVRFSLQRLCGITKNSARIVDSGEIPKSLSRVLKRLRSFPTDPEAAGQDIHIATVLAAVFETRFAAARYESEDYSEGIEQVGAVTDLLAHTAKTVVYTIVSLHNDCPR